MAAGVGAGFAIFCVIGVGCLAAWMSLHAAGLRGRRLGLHTAAFGPGMGLGIASLLTFFCRTLGLPRPGLLVLLGTGALLAGGIAAWRRRRPSREEISPPAPPARAPFFVQVVALLMLLVSAGLVLETFRVVSRAWPEGTYDAVAIWNTRARLLDRGYDQAPELLKRSEPYGHPNYPLLLPGAVATQMGIAGPSAGEEDPWVSRLTGLTFVVALGLLVFAVVADSGSLPLAALATSLVWSNPMLLKWSGSQCADIPVAYYFLGSVAVLASRLPGRRDGPLPLALGGAFLGFLAWTKNEGVVMLLLAAGLYGLWKLWQRQFQGLGREALALAAGLLPGLLAVFLFKRSWAPESGLGTFFSGDALERVMSVERWLVPVREIVQRLVPLESGSGWSPVWPLLLAGVGLAVWAQLRFRRPWASFWGACLLATVGSWIPIFAVTPYEQMWHISSSLDRLYLQVFPALVAGLFLRLAWALREKAGGPVRRFEPGTAGLAGALPLIGILGVALAIKAHVVATYLPRIWLFWDELFYTMTAYDIAHWGERGVPHPDAFFYPPLTSLVIAPFYALGIHPTLIYHLGLLLFHVLLTSAVLAGVLLLRRLFGTDSRLLVAVLALGPPAYTALTLMSEPLFVALYTWFLYFLVRMIQERRPRDAWVAGLLLAGLVLTRFTGYLVAGSLVLGAVWELLRTRDRRTLWLHLQALVPAVAAFLVWRGIAPHVKTAFPMDDPLVLLAVIVNFPLELALGAARRFVAEIGYVSLSTFGFALPASLWLAVRSGREVRLFLLHVLSFLGMACGLAAVFMWFGAIRSTLPRFDMYGRYVEYFAIPLLVAAFGALLRLREPVEFRSRAALAAGALLLNAVLLLFIPERFYTGSLEQNQVAPNSLGIAWLLATVGGLGLWSRWLAPVLAALLLWGLTSRGRLRQATAGALVLLTVVNFALAVRETSIPSFGSATYASVVSDYLTAHPEAFAEGLYVDYPEYLRDDGPVKDYSTVYRVMTDHPEKVIAGREPGPYVGKMPVLTWRPLDRPVLAEWPHLTYRIYAP